MPTDGEHTARCAGCGTDGWAIPGFSHWAAITGRGALCHACYHTRPGKRRRRCYACEDWPAPPPTSAGGARARGEVAG